MHQSVSCVQGFGSCSGETAHREQEKSEVQQYCRLHDSHSAQLTISLSFFIGRARTVLDAGLALKVHGSFVNGLTPFRAGWAGFFFSFMFKAPASGNLNEALDNSLHLLGLQARGLGHGAVSSGGG